MCVAYHMRVEQARKAACIADWGSRVSWQEELRKLDEELAAGRLSADDYRVRRDQVLSSAVSHSDPNSGASSSTPEQGTTAPADQSGNAANPSDTSNSESTQIVRPIGAQQGQGAQAGAETTQVVRNQNFNPAQQAGQGWQAQPPPPAQHGYQQAPPGSPPAGFQQPQQSSWNAPDADVSPPWGGSDFPPIAASTETAWTAQGPESFDTERRSGKGKVIGIVAAVVVVLLIAGAVVYFAAFNTSEKADPGPTPTSEQQAPPAPTAPPIKTAGALVIPQGQTPGPKTFSPQELAASKSLPEPDRVVLEDIGFTGAKSVFVTNNNTTMSLWAFTTNDPQKLRDRFVEDQQRFGFEKLSGEASGVPVYGATQQNNDQDVYVFRAHYVSGNDVIRVQAFNTDRAAARELFNKVMQTQLQHNPQGG